MWRRGVRRKNVSRCMQRRFFSSSLPSEADAVVIGGGSIGASCAYHLQKSGLNTVLVEKHKLTAGTTWHSAGMLWRLRPSDADIEMHTYTRELARSLGESTGIESWTENGGLFIANNIQRLNEYKRLREIGKYFDIESRIVSPQEIQDIHPLLAVDDVVGGLYSPTDGTMDPTSWVMALAKAGKQLGLVVGEENGVKSIQIDQEGLSHYSKRIAGVTLEDGHHIKTRIVVNACGSWARATSLMAGADIPLRPMKHAFILTEKLEGMHAALPNVRDHDLSIYLKCQGDSLALGGYEQNPEFWHTIDPDFSFGLFDLDWDTFAQNLDGHIKRCPAVETAGIKSTVCGPESFTPDHKPLVGPDPSGPLGFYQCCGFNSMGLMLGGGIGRELVHWINTGSAELDIFSFDVARFHPDTIKDEVWVKNRTHESYAKTYAVVFPHDEALAGRQMRKSGVYDQLLANGCVFQARHGFERPGWFLPADQVKAFGDTIEPKPYDFYQAYSETSDLWRILGEERVDHNTVVPNNSDSHPYHRLIDGELTFDSWGDSMDIVKQECASCREGVVVFDQSYFGNFWIKGKSALDFVQYLCTADFKSRWNGLKDKAKRSDAWPVVYTMLLNDNAGTEADLTIGMLSDTEFYVSAGGNTRTKDFMWINRALQRFEKDNACAAGNVEVTDTADEITILSVQGPKSRELLSKYLQTDDGVTAGALSEAEFPFSHMRRMKFQAGKDSVDLLVLRLTFVGELGYELHVNSKKASYVYNALFGDEIEVKNAGYRCIDSLSAEKNFRHWHADLSNRDTPLEAGVGFSVLPKLKSCEDDFIGRARLEEIRKKNLTTRRLAGFALSGEQHALHGIESIWRNGECVGYVRSTAFGFSLGRQLAYGYVDFRPSEQEKAEFKAESGKELTVLKWLQDFPATWEIGDRDRKFPADMSLKAFFDPKNERVKGIVGNGASGGDSKPVENGLKQ